MRRCTDDQCGLSSGKCTSQVVTFGKQWGTAALETSSALGIATILNGDYTLALAAVPAGVGAGQDTLLLAGANDLWKCSLAMGCAWRNTTNSSRRQLYFLSRSWRTMVAAWGSLPVGKRQNCAALDQFLDVAGRHVETSLALLATVPPPVRTVFLPLALVRRDLEWMCAPRRSLCTASGIQVSDIVDVMASVARDLREFVAPEGEFFSVWRQQSGLDRFHSVRG